MSTGQDDLADIESLRRSSLHPKSATRFATLQTLLVRRDVSVWTVPNIAIQASNKQQLIATGFQKQLSFSYLKAHHQQ